MKRVLLVCVLMLVLLLTACEQQDLPAEPGAPGTTPTDSLVGQAVETVYEDYASPTSFFIDPNRVLLLGEDDVEQVELSVIESEREMPPVEIDEDTGFAKRVVYKYGYFTDEDGEWIRFTFGGDQIGTSNWLWNDAPTTDDVDHEFNVDVDSFPYGEYYVVAYACSKSGTWDCHGNQWMIQEFVTSDSSFELPDEPDFDTCTPKTQEECLKQEFAGGIYECGDVDDGCEGTVNCDMQAYAGGLACPTGRICERNLCVESEVALLACGDVISDDGIFNIDGTGYEYKGADDNIASNPKAKVKNLETSETIERSVSFAEEVGSFNIKHGGLTYNFESASDTSVDDWDIRYVCAEEEPVVAELSCYTNVVDEEEFELGGVHFEYKGADKMTDTAPKMRFKNWETGETIERSTEVKALFTVKEGGYSYYFNSASNYLFDDWDIALRHPCDAGTDCGMVIADEALFTLNEVNFEYKGADDLERDSPKVRYKNLATGETIERSPWEAAIFTLNSEGVTYYFASASDHEVDDYEIELLYPCSGSSSGGGGGGGSSE